MRKFFKELKTNIIGFITYIKGTFNIRRILLALVFDIVNMTCVYAVHYLPIHDILNVVCQHATMLLILALVLALVDRHFWDLTKNRLLIFSVEIIIAWMVYLYLFYFFSYYMPGFIYLVEYVYYVVVVWIVFLMLRISHVICLNFKR